jgi:hypothetical protein
MAPADKYGQVVKIKTKKEVEMPPPKMNLKYCGRFTNSQTTAALRKALRARVQRLKSTCHVASLRHVF